MTDDRQPAYESAAASQKAPDRLGELQDKAYEAGRDIAGKIQDAGRDIADRAQAFGAEGEQLASEYYQQGREQALVWQKQLELQIREKPIQSLCIAGGIGVLLGLILRR